LLNDRKIKKLVDDNVAKLSIKTPSNKTLIQSLSGGNQQKVLVSRWLANDPDILIMDEPTRGIDVGAKYEIYKLINNLVENEGKTILLISSEMEELMGMSDRIVVLAEGGITGTLEKDEFDPDTILAYASAIKEGHGYANAG
jgi:methyl-galactoside transport system ATP-binding protein